MLESIDHVGLNPVLLAEDDLLEKRGMPINGNAQKSDGTLYQKELV